MIFLIYTIRTKKGIEVVIYDSLDDLSQRVDWQDILDPSIKILDEEGKIYVWDDSKENEVGTVYGYSFKIIGTDLELLQKCKTRFEQLGQPGEFEIETNER